MARHNDSRHRLDKERGALARRPLITESLSQDLHHHTGDGRPGQGKTQPLGPARAARAVDLREECYARLGPLEFCARQAAMACEAGDDALLAYHLRRLKDLAAAALLTGRDIARLHFEQAGDGWRQEEVA